MNLAEYLKDYPQIDQLPEIDPALFASNYGTQGKPLLLTEVAKEWYAVKHWTEDFIAEKFGDVTVMASREIAGAPEKKAFQVGEYFSYMHNCEDEHPFYLSNCQFHLGTALTGHYNVPACFECWYGKIPYGQRKRSLSWLFIGARHTYSKLHLDIWNTSAWNVVITGKKLWMFYPKSQEPLLYGGKVNPFDPDYDRFPGFRHASPLVCVQHPGQLVYTPSDCWHAVYNLEGGISLTENFINEINYKLVLEFFSSRNSTSNYNAVQKLVTENLGLAGQV